MNPLERCAVLFVDDDPRVLQGLRRMLHAERHHWDLQFAASGREALACLERNTFDALVTGASEKGTYVRLITPPAEGRVLRGEHGLKVGQKVRVRLLKTDPYNGFIDFECTGRDQGFYPQSKK